jgi:hypothetical protein
MRRIDLVKLGRKSKVAFEDYVGQACEGPPAHQQPICLCYLPYSTYKQTCHPIYENHYSLGAYRNQVLNYAMFAWDRQSFSYIQLVLRQF